MPEFSIPAAGGHEPPSVGERPPTGWSQERFAAMKRERTKEFQRGAHDKPSSYIVPPKDLSEIPGTASHEIEQRYEEFKEMHAEGRLSEMKNAFLTILKKAMGKRYGMVLKNPKDPKSERVFGPVTQTDKKIGREEVSTGRYRYWEMQISAVEDADNMMSLITHFLLKAKQEPVLSISRVSPGAGRKFMEPGQEAFLNAPPRRRETFEGLKPLSDGLLMLIETVILQDQVIALSEMARPDLSQVPGNPAYEFGKVLDQFFAKSHEFDQAIENGEKVVVTPEDYQALKDLWLGTLRKMRGRGISDENIREVESKIKVMEQEGKGLNYLYNKVVSFGTDWLMKAKNLGVIKSDIHEDDLGVEAPPEAAVPEIEAPEDVTTAGPKALDKAEEIASAIYNNPSTVGFDDGIDGEVSVWIELPEGLELSRADDEGIVDALAAPSSVLADAVVQALPEHVKLGPSNDWKVEIIPPKMLIITVRTIPHPDRTI
ncbi:MAG: hypothetical protein Q8K86_05825 [Candidatus Nanopelagicaceae bacterium]|nr:hypothetical protein [Candidatus Nanopelagicaceae bacterium]